MMLLDEDTRLPGIAALPLCVAVAAIIHVHADWMNRVNSFTRLGCWIGRISYSAYLVHWPLVVFYTGKGYELDGQVAMVFVIATFAIAQVMRRYVEQPFLSIPIRRFSMAIPVTAILVFAVIPLSMPIYSSIHSGRKNLDDLIVQLEPRNDLVRRLVDATRARSGGPVEVVVTGDSHAVDLMLGLKLVAPTFMNIKLVRALCDPLVGEFTDRELTDLYEDHPSRTPTPDRCRDVHATKLLEKYVKADPDIILYSDKWRFEALPYLRDTIERVRTATGARIVILGRNTEFELSPDLMLDLVDNDFEINETAWHQKVDHDALNDALRRIAIDAGVEFIEKEDLVCVARGSCDYLMDENLTYVDLNHWSETGMKIFSARLVDRLEAEKLIIEP